MKMTGNTILITGGASGIGLALAEEFKKLGNEVVVAGRSKEKLKKAEGLGFKTYAVDMTNSESIKSLAASVTQEFPNLNAVIQNAGIMLPEDILSGDNSKTQNDTIATNLLGPMRLTDALLPHFKKQKSATIMTVTSGLAYMPLTGFPTYCATKAALHSYTESLRYQLQDTSIAVIELPPPYVQTHLGGERQANDPHAMPLGEFITEVMTILKTEPNVKEVLVKRVQPLRFAYVEGQQKYDGMFKQFNDAMKVHLKS